MLQVATFNPATMPTGSFSIGGTSKTLVIHNESAIGINFTFQNGSVKYCPSWTSIRVQGPFGGSLVTYAQKNATPTNANSVSQTIIEEYDCGEYVEGAFPLGLTRNVNVPTTVQTNANAMSQLINDNNPANTQIIESTVQGDGSSAVSLTNDAHLILGTPANPGSVSFDNTKITSNGAGIFSALGLVVSNSLKVNTVNTINGTTAGTVSIYEILQGTFKLMYVFYNGYENASATEQTINLPTPITNYGGWIAHGPVPIAHVYKSGIQLTNVYGVIDSFPSGNGSGGRHGANAINGFSYGEITNYGSGFDAVGFGTNHSSTWTAGLFLFGV